MEITLQVIFVYVKPHLKMHYVLSPIQQLLLTLLRRIVAKILDTDSECTVQLLVEFLLPLSMFYLLG